LNIARATLGDTPFWAVVDLDSRSARRLSGTYAEWGAAITAGAGEEALTFQGAAVRLDDLRLLPPIERGSQVVVVGANYLSHLKNDFQFEPTRIPVAFLKSIRALVGATDPIWYPSMTEKLDYEVELVVVMGAAVDRAHPMRSVLGYTVGNDVSARDLQAGNPSIGLDLFSAKSLDGTTPLGPWIVTRDEFGDAPPDLRLSLTVNGEPRQDDRTSAMRWNVEELINFVDQRVAFEPGDVMFTGTPAGVGHSDGRFLQPGDLVEARIEKIGALSNRVERRSWRD
jgi:2-keto-4-pentenoate hydratase/2-oxohepta-3-ene-1,7-dioic acid hydratase in catechol pathway